MKFDANKDINYNILTPGIYLNKINDDITVYDVRLKQPNAEAVLTNAAIHTIEHIAQEYIATTEFAEDIITFAPVGSRTGFQLITRRLSDKYSIDLIKNIFDHIANFWDKIPRSSMYECGNCLDLNLPQAKEESKKFLNTIKEWTKEDLKYPVQEEEE